MHYQGRIGRGTRAVPSAYVTIGTDNVNGLVANVRHFVPSTMGRLTHSGSFSESDTYWKLGSYTICLRLGLGHGSELGLCWPARKGTLEGKGDTAARQYVVELTDGRMAQFRRTGEKKS